MFIKNMFTKPVDRDIKGVIKVSQGDDENVKQELEEYVVTKELQKHFADFFESYKKGIVGTVVLGVGGAVAGIESKTQQVYKCQDCGMTLSYSMPENLKSSRFPCPARPVM